jgi:hypothetical protein
MHSQVSRNRAVEVAPMKDETVLFQPETSKFCLLNVTAAFVWNQLETPHAVPELAQKLCEHFDGVSSPKAVQDVEMIVNELLSLECLVSSQT